MRERQAWSYITGISLVRVRRWYKFLFISSYKKKQNVKICVRDRCAAGRHRAEQPLAVEADIQLRRGDNNSTGGAVCAARWDMLTQRRLRSRQPGSRTGKPLPEAEASWRRLLLPLKAIFGTWI